MSRWVLDSCFRTLTAHHLSGSIAPYAPARSATRWHIDAPHTLHGTRRTLAPLCATFSCAALEMHALLGSLHLPPHIRIGKDTWRAWKGECRRVARCTAGPLCVPFCTFTSYTGFLGGDAFPRLKFFANSHPRNTPLAWQRERQAYRPRTLAGERLVHGHGPEILIELDHGQVKWYGARLS